MSELKFYRYKAGQDAAKDIDGEYVAPLFVSPKIYLQDYDLIKETEKGYWIGYMGIKHKWVSKTSKKKYAYLTKEEAMVNYIKRTESYIKILKGQLEFAQAALSVARDFKV